MDDKSAIMREKILKAALGLFARFGFKKTSMDDIANALHMGKATIYHYFKGKEEIFAEVVRFEGERFLEQLRQGVEEKETASAKVRAFFTIRLALMKQMAHLAKVSDQALAELWPMAEDARQEFFIHEVDLLENVLVEGQQAGEFELDKPRLVALTLLSANKGLDVVFLRMRDTPELEEGLKVMLDLLLKALTPPPRTISDR